MSDREERVDLQEALQRLRDARLRLESRSKVPPAPERPRLVLIKGGRDA